MVKSRLLMSAVALSVVMGSAAHAQGLIGGAERGASDGGAAAGPVGAIVGGAVGAAAGTVGGILGVEDRPRFRRYVESERVSSYRYDGPVRAGVVLPESGVTYYDVPSEYRVRDGYRYTVINGSPVLVEPRSRRVVEVIE